MWSVKGVPLRSSLQQAPFFVAVLELEIGCELHPSIRTQSRPERRELLPTTSTTVCMEHLTENKVLSPVYLEWPYCSNVGGNSKNKFPDCIPLFIFFLDREMSLMATMPNKPQCCLMKSLKCFLCCRFISYCHTHFARQDPSNQPSSSLLIGCTPTLTQAEEPLPL